MSITITLLIATLWCLPASTNQQYYQGKKGKFLFLDQGMCREKQKQSKELYLKIQAVTFQKQHKCSLDPVSYTDWDGIPFAQAKPCSL